MSLCSRLSTKMIIKVNISINRRPPASITYFGHILARGATVRKLLIFFFIFFLFSLPIYGISQQPPPSIQIYFFYAEDCQPCQIILQSYLPSLKTMVPALEIKTFDVGNPVHYEALA